MKLKIFASCMALLSLCVLATADVQELVVEKFSPKDEGKLPHGWVSRNDDMTKEAAKVYKIVVDGNNAYLQADSKDDAIQIGKKIEVDLEQYPILTWKWKVDKLCEGANEKFKKTGDSPAAIYVVFPHWKKWNPTAIKYVWSASDLPVGYKTQSPYASDTKIIILQNNLSPLGKWIEQKVNVRADYESFWGKSLKKVQLVAIMSDSDNTKKEAIAAYDDIIFQASGAETK